MPPKTVKPKLRWHRWEKGIISLFLASGQTVVVRGEVRTRLDVVLDRTVDYEIRSDQIELPPRLEDVVAITVR